MDEDKATLCAGPTQARTLDADHARGRCLPRPVGGRRAEAGMVDDGGEPLILALANPSRRSCPSWSRRRRGRRDHRHRAHRLSEPGQQRPVLPVHLPRRARLPARRRSTRRWRSPPCTPSPIWRRPSKRRRRRRLRRAENLRFGPEYLIPKPFDPRLMMEIAPAVAQAADGFGRGDAADRRHARPTATKLQSFVYALGH